MTRWISSDENTTRALRERNCAVEAGSGEWITDAVSNPPAVLLLPGAGSQVLVARIQRGVQPASETGFNVARWTDEKAVGYQAGGMLGLLDEPVYEEEPQSKKRWWKK